MSKNAKKKKQRKQFPRSRSGTHLTLGQQPTRGQQASADRISAEDKAWFEAHPDAREILRKPYPDELPHPPSPTTLLYVVKIRDDVRLRREITFDSATQAYYPAIGRALTTHQRVNVTGQGLAKIKEVRDLIGKVFPEELQSLCAQSYPYSLKSNAAQWSLPQKMRYSPVIPDEDKEAIAKTILVDTSAAAEYFYTNPTIETWDWHDFVLAPPFHDCFAYANAPSSLASQGQLGPWPPEYGRAWGSLCRWYEVQNESERHQLFTLFHEHSASPQPWWDEVKWLLAVFLYREELNEDQEIICIGPVFHARFFLNASGKICTDDTGSLKMEFCFQAETIESVRRVAQGNANEAQEFLDLQANLFEGCIGTNLLGISFLHERSGYILEQLPQTRQQSEEKKRTILQSLEQCEPKRHYTLEVDHTRLRRYGVTLHPGTRKQAYHLCRGHFADYTHGKGLFGKYKGVFWIPEHNKGKKAFGEIEKDYRVK